jgi:hypothetical protein
LTGDRADRLPIILQLDADEFAVAVWLRDEAGEPIYDPPP